LAGADKHKFHWRLYNGEAPARLWRGQALAGALLLALACGGCSMSYQLDSLFGSSDKSEQTGSVKSQPAAAQQGKLPPARDLDFAKAAVSKVLNRDDKYASQPWENPRSGARGTVTPIASAYSQDGQTCRDFLASYVNGSAQSWMQGEACKLDKGEWEVRSLKPWKRS
jgi:surface antigen